MIVKKTLFIVLAMLVALPLIGAAAGGRFENDPYADFNHDDSNLAAFIRLPANPEQDFPAKSFRNVNIGQLMQNPNNRLIRSERMGKILEIREAYNISMKHLLSGKQKQDEQIQRDLQNAIKPDAMDLTGMKSHSAEIHAVCQRYNDDLSIILRQNALPILIAAFPPSVRPFLLQNPLINTAQSGHPLKFF